mmetsp:Transcript_33988/g.105603  ORF Transcript_33988/g.105603 Transcript_33988/m.105603 type:complete len:223 (+) Transcript_33988:770-1438(+)
MEVFVASISALRLSMVLPRSEIFTCKPVFLSSAAAVSCSFVASSCVHQSRCLTSSSCWTFSSATILSMAAFTFTKPSSFADAANAASLGSEPRPAARCSTAAARARRRRSETDAVCTSATLTVLSKLSKASSEFRILIVSCTAAISSKRLLTRASYSAADSEHFCLRLAKNSSSSVSCAWVSSYSFSAWTCFSPLSAMSASICCTAFCADAICCSLAAFRLS